MVETPIDAQAEFSERVSDTLTRVLGSSLFAGSPRLRQFLRYTVEHSLQGELADLKEVCIGVSVFGKAPSYDPKSEPIVRVEARRLRARLEEYYSSEGQGDSIRILLPKGGYQATFVAHAAAAEKIPMADLPAEQAEAAPPPAGHTAGARAVGRRMLFLALAIAVLAFTAGACLVWLLGWKQLKPLVFRRIVPLTTSPGVELQPAISNDGKQIAYVWSGEHGTNYDIYVKLIDVGTAIRLTTSEDEDLGPRWSPDDRYIAFERVAQDEMGIYVVPALGGTERKVAAIHLPSSWKPEALSVEMTSMPTWSADGKALIVSDRDEAAPGAEALFLVPLDGSPRHRLTAPTGLLRDRDPCASHDGRHLAFVRQTTNSSADLFVTDPDGNHPRQVTFDQMSLHGFTWGPDDRSLLFASNRSGADELWQVPIEGGTPLNVMATGDRIADPTISGDGGILGYTATTENSNIWRVDLGDRHGTGPGSTPGNALLKAEPLLVSSGRNTSARYSPDGQKIAFVSDRSGSWELWVSDSDGHELRELTSFGGPVVGTPHWSPDSRLLVFDARPNGRSLIYTVGLDGGKPVQAVNDGFEDKKPYWSRDGRSLYYTSSRNGPSQLWKSGLHGENAILISAEPSNDGAESLDGRTVYFQGTLSGLFRVPSGGGTASRIDALSGLRTHRYFDVGARIYFLQQDKGTSLIEAYDPVSGSVTPIGQIQAQPVYGTPSLSVSPDEHSLLFAVSDKLTSRILTLRR